MTDKWYGWYSEKQAKIGKDTHMLGTVWDIDLRPSKYTTPDGRVVVVTQVTRTPTDPENLCGDSVYLGEVIKWLGKV